MRDLYLNFGALMAAAWYAKKRRQQPPPGKNQVLQSRRMEDEVYRQNRPRSEALEEVRRTCEAKFPLIENLSRDVFQSLYSQHPEQRAKRTVSAGAPFQPAYPGRNHEVAGLPSHEIHL